MAKRTFVKDSLEDLVSYEAGELGEGDPGGDRYEDHIHEKHTLTMGIHGEDVRTGRVLHVNLHFCPKCKLVWFEELEPTSRLMMPVGPGRG